MPSGHEHIESSSDAGDSDDLMTELLAITDPHQLSEIYTSGELYGKAASQQQYLDLLSTEARELQDMLDAVTIKADNANALKSAYLEAFELARAIEDGK